MKQIYQTNAYTMTALDGGYSRLVTRVQAESPEEATRRLQDLFSQFHVYVLPHCALEPDGSLMDLAQEEASDTPRAVAMHMASVLRDYCKRHNVNIEDAAKMLAF